jgi:hypothetical protein
MVKKHLFLSVKKKQKIGREVKNVSDESEMQIIEL